MVRYVNLKVTSRQPGEILTVILLLASRSRSIILDFVSPETFTMSRTKELALLIAAGAALVSSAAYAEKNQKKIGVIAEAIVMAPPELAFQSVRAMRDEDPSGCKVLSSSQNECVVEEVFDGLPVIGNAVCVYKETYEPSKTIGFKMIRSDKLKAFEGEWTFEPTDQGQHTLVRLRSYIDTGLKIPFVKQLTHIAGTSEVKRQLADLKQSAEAKQKRFGCGKQVSL